MNDEDMYRVEMVAGDHRQDLRIIADDRDAAIDVALSIDYSPNDVWSESEGKVIDPEEGFSVTWHLDP